MIRVELTISRRHLSALVGILIAAALAVPGISWAADRFDDVPSSNVFSADIEWLADAGITKGCNPPANTRYCPGSNVTREQMAAFMHRLSGGDDRTIDGRLDALEAENGRLKALLAGLSRDGDTLLFDGMNLQVVNGQGATETKNSLGNVIIGYNEDNPEEAETRTGSHYLVIGRGHSYSSFSGLVAGYANTASARYASVTGGYGNTASDHYASVTGGYGNTASDHYASVTGGYGNTASARYASVTGGYGNTASDHYASVTGGKGNTASARYASVTGGHNNTASDAAASVTGGYGNTASRSYASVTGGGDNTADADGASVSGGFANTVGGEYSSILGGRDQMLTTMLSMHPPAP